MKFEKPQGTKRTINLDVLRDQGFNIDIQNNDASGLPAKVFVTARHVRQGPVLMEEVSAELEQTYGVKKANAVQKSAVALINNMMFREALRLATK